MTYKMTATITVEARTKKPSTIAKNMDALDLAIKRAVKNSFSKVEIGPVAIPTEDGLLAIAKCPQCGNTFTSNIREWREAFSAGRYLSFAKCPACGHETLVYKY